MKSFASLAATVGSYIYISDKPSEDTTNPFYNMNGPLFEELTSKFKNLEVDAIKLQSFISWGAQYNKQYKDADEFKLRLATFLSNVDQLEQIYSETEFLSEDLHEMGLNKFADWTDEEYTAMLGFRPSDSSNSSADILDYSDLPESINWVEQGMVSPVKDQGHCGSCWSFSTTGSIESAM